MAISSGYGAGNSFTNTTAPGGMDVSPFLQALLAQEQRFLQQRSAGPQRSGNPLGGRTTAGPRMSRPTEGGRSSMNRLKEKGLAAQVAKERAEAHALTARAPTRISSPGFGSSTHVTQDVNAMTGAQRSAFLPGNSQMVGGYPGMAPDEEDWLARMRAGRGVR